MLDEEEASPHVAARHCLQLESKTGQQLMGPGTQGCGVQARSRGSGFKGCQNPGRFTSWATLAEAANSSVPPFPSQEDEVVTVKPPHGESMRPKPLTYVENA